LNAAAPHWSRYHAARLFHAIPGASPNLVKALLLQFTDEVHTLPLPSPVEPAHITGFGEPNIRSALNSPVSSAVYIYEGEIQSDTYLYMPFYVPKALAAASGRGRLVVRGTVVFDPPVDPDNRVEYSKARMTFQLRKKLAVGFREVAVGSGEEDSRLAWNPVLKFAKRFSRGFSAGEWELRLRLFTRGGLPADFKQTLAIVLEIQDSTGGINLADHILSEMPGIYAPLVIPIAA
jgi:hypothetical protein